MARGILITGAGAAGNATALRLGRYGFDVTPVERTSAFRDSGQNIDVRGHRLGRRQGQGPDRIRRRRCGGMGTTAEMEILRGDLARLIYDAARDMVTVRFGDSVTGIEQDHEGSWSPSRAAPPSATTR